MITPYIQEAELDELISLYFRKEVRERFLTMEKVDQQALILRYQLLFDSLPWIGTAADPEQLTAWPRIIKGEVKEFPSRLKVALIMQSETWLADGDTDFTEFRKLRNEGVSSYSIDDLSVSFDKSNSDEVYSLLTGLDKSVMFLIRPYLLLGGPCYVPR